VSTLAFFLRKEKLVYCSAVCIRTAKSHQELKAEKKIILQIQRHSVTPRSPRGGIHVIPDFCVDPRITTEEQGILRSVFPVPVEICLDYLQKIESTEMG
jgi:hypothetical protein